MEFTFSPEDDAFRRDVRRFIEENLPPDIKRIGYRNFHAAPRDAIRRWQSLLNRQGWGAPHWPVEHGGTGWNPVHKHIFLEELYRADALDSGWQGLHMCAPVIIAFGSEEQKRRHLPPMRSGEIYWCQGFSEPNAGSDLANLKTSAVLDRDHYVVNGQKIWTSEAQHSQWGFFLVRTDPAAAKPQQGISFLLIDMATPGITVRQIDQIDGGHELNEVFLDNVRVPKENLVGEPNKGWTYAKYLLEKERTTSSFIYYNKRQLDIVKEIAAGERADGGRLIDQPDFKLRLARVELDLHALEWSVLRILAEDKGRFNADAVVSTLKIRGAEMQQRVTRLQVDALGPKAMRCFDFQKFPLEELDEEDGWPRYAAGRTAQYLINRASTIYGGAREVQKNIISKLAFGL
ncbi:acyl-CoA oxidase/dehydrogenase (plasmid) [Azospirillum sp. B510]|uniref:acyl-CoA dehydrogenase family protein n=1 Tax=Azospirillum sp. (strain B510) TaxID=137722 RepID=UPI0001C4CB8E|nr:acyl-CoA dehydrogenase family protein [Azospirillum sp. B510]BAI74831.1 acyl-CoA oxidase/dehydrogenase [Azospirillum sp. B510]